MNERPASMHAGKGESIESAEDFSIRLKHFELKLFNGRGQEVPNDTGVFSIEFPRYEDVLDLVPYIKNEGEPPKIALTRSFRPIVTERARLGAGSEALKVSEDSPQMWEAFGGYIRPEEGEAGMDASAARILERKLPGAAQLGGLETLGGSYFPSVGTATEIVYPRAQRIRVPEELDEHIEFKTPQEVVDGYLEGKYFSMRLVELAFRFARSMRIPMNSDHTPLKSFAPVDVTSIQDKILDVAEARQLISTLDVHNASITHIESHETNAPAEPFLKAVQSEVTLPDGKSALFDFVMRQGFDSVDVGCFVPAGDRILIPVKAGVRPSLAVRNLESHPIHTDTSPIFIEGVAGALKGTERSLEEVKELAKDEVREEIGIEPSTLIPIGYDYPSPGHNLERTYRYLAPVDPAQVTFRPQTADETVGVWYVELNDLLQLVDEGVIRDPRLALNTRLVAYLAGYPQRERPHVSRETELAYDELINRSSAIQAWLSETAREVDNRLSRSVYYRRLKSYCENELGIVALRLTHPDEAGFFSATVPVFAIPERTASHKMPFNFLHDLFHYATSGFVPLKKVHEDGTIEMHSFEEYYEAVGGNECHAVWYSDQVIPEEFGITEAEEIFGGHSVAGAFKAMGMDAEAARLAIRTIELRGEIPKEILEHPEFETYRSVFIGRLLKYHVYDSTKIRGVYEYWKEHPFVLKTAARFCNAFTDLADYEKHYLATLSAIASYTEGLNPLRAHLSRTQNVQVRLGALRLAVLYEHLENRGGTEVQKESVRSQLAALANIYDEVSSMRMEINDIDPSPEHLAVVERVGQWESGIFAETDRLAASLLDDRAIFTDEEAADLSARVLPFFEPFVAISNEEVAERLIELERQSREKS